MHKLSAIFWVFLLVFAVRVVADEIPQQETTIVIYRVGDLVSSSVINASAWGHGLTKSETNQQWGAEYKETLEALDELQALLVSMCPSEPVAVAVRRQTLSLVIRHTPDGHREIEALLKTLRVEEDPCIRLECRALLALESSDVDNLSEDQQVRLSELIFQSTLTSEQAREVNELVPPNMTRTETVRLKAGRRTPWGALGRPCTAVGRVVNGKGVVQLRVDYIADDVSETVPVASQRFEIEDGCSAVFHHYCDGGTVVWLIKAEIIGMQSDKATTRKSAVADQREQPQRIR